MVALDNIYIYIDATSSCCIQIVGFYHKLHLDFTTNLIYNGLHFVLDIFKLTCHPLIQFNIYVETMDPH